MASEVEKLISSMSDENKELRKQLLNQELSRIERPAYMKTNFIYWLGIVTILMAFGSLVILMFQEVPEQNKSIVDMSVGFIFGSGLATILNFFFGSHMDSADTNLLKPPS
jgi:hypothetical protein